MPVRAPTKPCAESTFPPHWLCVWLAQVRTNLCQALKHSQAATKHHQTIYNALPSALPQSHSNTTSPGRSHKLIHALAPLSPSTLSLLRYSAKPATYIRKLTSIYRTHRVVVLPTPAQSPLTPFEDVFFGAERAQFLHLAQFLQVNPISRLFSYCCVHSASNSEGKEERHSCSLKKSIENKECTQKKLHNHIDDIQGAPPFFLNQVFISVKTNNFPPRCVNVF